MLIPSRADHYCIYTTEGIYEDMNAVIAWQHYWGSTNANDTLAEYVSFEYSPRVDDVTAVMQAVGLLELTWEGKHRDSLAMTAKAFTLLASVDARMTPQAKGAWRWRLLLLRAQSDALVAANNGKLCGPVTTLPPPPCESARGH